MGRVLVLFLIAAAAQDAYTTFNDPAGRFQFRYPAGWQLFTGKRLAESTLLSYIPLCQPEAIACVTEPPTEFKGSNFEGASFQISACTKSDGLQTDRTINGVRFTHGSRDGAAAGHSSNTEIYRTDHGGVCYEVLLTTTQTSIAITPAGSRKFSAIELEKVQKRLDAILESLRFIS